MVPTPPLREEPQPDAAPAPDGRAAFTSARETVEASAVLLSLLDPADEGACLHLRGVLDDLASAAHLPTGARQALGTASSAISRASAGEGSAAHLSDAARFLEGAAAQ